MGIKKPNNLLLKEPSGSFFAGKAGSLRANLSFTWPEDGYYPKCW